MDWIKIEDKSPTEFEQHLFFESEFHGIFVGVLFKNKFYFVNNCDEKVVIKNPTHWMPLPNEPKD